VDFDYDKILQTYDLEDIFYQNDLTEAEVLEHLVETDYIRLPNPRPTDI
jgi:hypothetical protein